MHFSIFLVLGLSLMLWAEPDSLPPPGRPSCALTTEQLKKKSADLYTATKAKLKNPAALDECWSDFDKRINECDKLEKNLGDCNAAGLTAANEDKTDGIRKTFVKTSKGLVETSNCSHTVGHCYRTGQGLAGKIEVPRNSERCKGVQGTDPEDQKVLDDYKSQFEKNIETPQFQCWRASGDAAEALARSTTAQTVSAFGGKSAVDCIDNHSGLRVCQYSDDGTLFKPINAKEDLQNSALISLNGGSKSCSGKLLGDGQTVITAGHCTENASGDQTLYVYDKDGNMHTVTGNCVKGVVTPDVNGEDTSYCRLYSKIPASPTYVATLDPSQTTGCRTEGYLMKCAPDFFQNLSSQPVTMRAFPAQKDEVTGRVTGGVPFQTSGTLYYDSERQNLWSRNMLCTQGCSGGGYIVNYQGREVVVGAHAYNAEPSPVSGAHVIPVGIFDGLKIQSVSTRKLAEGTILFQSMPM